MKKTLIFDANILVCAAHKNSSRSGIFFTAYNIARILNANKNINLVFYCDFNSYQQLKFVTKTLMPEFRNVNIYSPNVKNYYDKLIDFIVSLKNYSKNERHPILAKIFHLYGLLLKILFFIPRKIVKVKFSPMNADIFFSPCHKIPDMFANNDRIKKYTLIHDVIPFLLPEYFEVALKKSHGHYWLEELVQYMKQHKQDKYFSNSLCTKNDFLKLIPELKPEQITVTLLACAESFHPCSKQETISSLKKYNLPTDKKYVFSLCSLEPRKNLIRAVKTFIQFIKKNKINDMVFILGGGHWEEFIGKLNAEIADLGKYKDKIIQAGYIDDEDLAPLYSGAEWFVYTSQYEGFGLPVLEAMACGCPVITSNKSSLPEVVGDTAIKIAYDSDAQHVEAYEKYYFNKKYRDKMAGKGLERAKKFSWDKTVNLMVAEMLK